MGDRIRSFRDLRVYQEAFRLQQEVFEVSKGFPKEELYSLTDQIRRSSRSIGANLAEAWHKRRYQAHFLSAHLGGQAFLIVVIFLAPRLNESKSRFNGTGGFHGLHGLTSGEDDGGQFGNGLTLKALRKRRMG
jgi:hypothetical protein